MQLHPLMALDRVHVSAWIAAYERAWRTAGTESLRRLFTDDATYRMSPFEGPASGLAEIGVLWKRERRGPDEEFTVTHDVVAVEGETAVVRLEVRYGEPGHQRYRDLWVLRFAADGRCCEFEEWPFWPGQQIIAEGGEQ